MMTVITGGSGSGKSAYAEAYLCERANDRPKYYIATMKCSDAEGEKRIERHRKQRQGKGFITIEQPVRIQQAAETIADSGQAEKKGCALLECMSNLVANEMFFEDADGQFNVIDADTVVHTIRTGIRLLQEQCGELVIVTNNVFEDGIRYDDATMEYLRAMGFVNRELAAMADQVIEVVVGIPIRLKE